MGIPVLERAIPREMLYIADEVFFTGTAAEITPIRSVDKVKVGAGKRGPSLRQRFKSNSLTSSRVRSKTSSDGSPGLRLRKPHRRQSRLWL